MASGHTDIHNYRISAKFNWALIPPSDRQPKRWEPSPTAGRSYRPAIAMFDPIGAERETVGLSAYCELIRDESCNRIQSLPQRRESWPMNKLGRRILANGGLFLFVL